MYSKMRLKDRKRTMIRNKIADEGKKLFLEKGFDQVSVAEIAKKSNVSVKTLFTYFDSKEDILFKDETIFLNELLRTIEQWDTNTSIVYPIKSIVYDGAFTSDQYIEMRIEYRKILATDKKKKLTSKLLLMWHSYEILIADTLAAKLGLDKNDPKLYVLTNAIFLPFRMIINYHIKNDRILDFENSEDRKWLEEIFLLMEHMTNSGFM